MDFLKALHKNKIEQCNLAFFELINQNEVVIVKEAYIDWLIKYKELYNSLDFESTMISEYDDFRRLYFDLNLIKNYQELENVSKEPVIDFQNCINEITLLKWLVKYEDVSENLFSFWINELDEITEADTFFYSTKIKIGTKDFKNIIELKKLYWDSYFDMIKKYINEEFKSSNKTLKLSEILEFRGMNLI